VTPSRDLLNTRTEDETAEMEPNIANAGKEMSDARAPIHPNRIANAVLFAAKHSRGSETTFFREQITRLGNFTSFKTAVGTDSIQFPRYSASHDTLVGQLKHSNSADTDRLPAFS
jgi:hypothetical protein